jgi:hypothetical protein
LSYTNQEKEDVKDLLKSTLGDDAMKKVDEVVEMFEKGEIDEKIIESL